MIQATIVSPTLKDKEIDWSKQQLVKYRHSNKIIISTGTHEGGDFEGVVIDSDGFHAVGYIYKKWDKTMFTPLTEPITITFENK